MCYSAQIEASYDKFVRVHGAILDIHEFVKLYGFKAGTTGWTKLPKAMRDAFRKPTKQTGFELSNIVIEGDRRLEERLQSELAAQTERLHLAENVLASAKPTKKAENDQRVAKKKRKAAERNLADLHRRTSEPKDSRIYPGSYAPVMVRDEKSGKRVVLPMR